MRYWIYVFAAMGLFLSACDYVIYQSIEPNKADMQQETLEFYVYMLPSLLAFIAGLSYTWAKKLSAVIMVASGVFALFFLHNMALSVITAMVYVFTGIMILSEWEKTSQYKAHKRI